MTAPQIQQLAVDVYRRKISKGCTSSAIVAIQAKDFITDEGECIGWDESRYSACHAFFRSQGEREYRGVELSRMGQIRVYQFGHRFSATQSDTSLEPLTGLVISGQSVCVVKSTNLSALIGYLGR